MENLKQIFLFFDVDGTLISDNAKSQEDWPKENVRILFHKNINKILQQTKGNEEIHMCLNSDSPLEVLKQFTKDFGFNEKVKFKYIAENGVVFDGFSNELQEFIIAKNLGLSSDEIVTFKKQINDTTQQNPHSSKSIQNSLCRKEPDVTSHGFLKKEDLNKRDYNKYFYFGEGRQKSITVFSNKEFIGELGKQQWKNSSIDCSPEYNFFAIHKGKDYKNSKSNAYKLILDYYSQNNKDIQIYTFGNSESDIPKNIDKKHEGKITTYIVGEDSEKLETLKKTYPLIKTIYTENDFFKALCKSTNDLLQTLQKTIYNSVSF